METAKEVIDRAGLTDRQVNFIIEYYTDGYLTKEIGKKYGVSRSTVSVELKTARERLVKAGYSEPRKIKPARENPFDPAMLNSLVKKAGGYYQWVEEKRG